MCLQFEVQDSEIKQALLDMAAWKSLGMDDFPADFYQNTWNHIGENLRSFIHHLRHKDISLKDINFTDICLIPKLDNPQLVT